MSQVKGGRIDVLTTPVRTQVRTPPSELRVLTRASLVFVLQTRAGSVHRRD